MVLQAGDVAPDFELRNTHGTPIRLSELRGRKVMVVFFPFAFSGICTGELCEIRDRFDLFASSDVTLLAVSCDPMFTLKAWAEHEGFEFDLLSDFWPHGAVANDYGVFDETHGLAVRGSFLIDEEGIVRWAVVNERGQARDFQAYKEALASL